MDIILTTFNARYAHSALSLRYLKANLKELEDKALIQEFVINENIQTIAEKILANSPKIVGISTYIWNAGDVSQLIKIIKKVAPEVVLILGGPEVSHTPHRVDFDSADYFVKGEGEISFYELCRDILHENYPKEKWVAPQVPKLKEITLPYHLYTDHDIEARRIYLEASRGCPYECEFCLSAIDERVRYFDIDALMGSIETLWQRGARDFRFIDRTFNLNMKIAMRLIDYFLAKEEEYFLHFEVIPDNFPEKLKVKIVQFAPASLQLEVGIQTLNPDVANTINRPLNIPKIIENIKFLESTHAHMHVDLIVGLPSESIESFAKNLEMLASLTKSEIQIGILKKLSGTTINRHDIDFKMVYDDTPPYDVLSTSEINFSQMQEMKRFARFWDVAYNSGNFNKTVRLLWSDATVYEGFMKFSNWVYAKSESTHKFSLERFGALIFEFLVGENLHEDLVVAQSLVDDIMKIEGRKLPKFLYEYRDSLVLPEGHKQGIANKRQTKHVE